MPLSYTKVSKLVVMFSMYLILICWWSWSKIEVEIGTEGERKSQILGLEGILSQIKVYPRECQEDYQESWD